MAGNRFLFCGLEFKFISDNFPSYVVKSILNVSENGAMAMVPFAFNTVGNVSLAASVDTYVHFDEDSMT